MGEFIILVLANTICGAGVALLIIGHAVISTIPKHENSGIATSGAGAALVAIGSALIGSWPIVLLDVTWAWMSFRALIAGPPDYNSREDKPVRWVRQPGLTLLLLGGLVCAVSSAYLAAGFITSAIYLVAYYLYTRKHLSREGYLFITLLAAFPLLPHLFEARNYLVLFNEALGIATSSFGLLVCRERWREWSREVLWVRGTVNQP